MAFDRRPYVPRHPDPLSALAAGIESLEGIWRPGLSNDDLCSGVRTIYDLLLDDMIGQAWRSVGFAGEPSLVAYDYGEGERTFNELWEIAFADSIQTQDLDASPAPIPMRQFLRGTCIVVNARRVSREDLISWCRITLGKGSVHFSPDFERAMFERRLPFPQLFEIGMAVLTSPHVRRLCSQAGNRKSR